MGLRDRDNSKLIEPVLWFPSIESGTSINSSLVQGRFSSKACLPPSPGSGEAFTQLRAFSLLRNRLTPPKPPCSVPPNVLLTEVQPEGACKAQPWGHFRGTVGPGWPRFARDSRARESDLGGGGTCKVPDIGTAAPSSPPREAKTSSSQGGLILREGSGFILLRGEEDGA